MADLLMNLPDFLREQAAKPFSFETNTDCGMLLADWVWAAKGGADPAAAVRGTYHDQAGAAAILDAAGGFIDYVTGLAAAAGCPVTTDPQENDIGVIDLPTGLTGGIMTNGSWAFRTAKGMAWSKVSAGRVVKAWRVDA